jgi:hypothetical protein
VKICSVFQQSVKQEIVDLLNTTKKELMDPFEGLMGMADTFINRYGKVFGIIKSVKDAYTILKEG